MLTGGICDLDSHLQMSADQLAAVFGTETGQLTSFIKGAPRLASRRERELSFDPARVWSLKGVNCFGSADPLERLKVLEAMGITRQLVLPRVRVTHAAWNSPRKKGFELALRYNDFIADWQSCKRETLYGAGIMTMRDPADAIAIAKSAHERGVRCLLIPCTEPPAGCSPADPAWDALWRLMADCEIALVIHAGSEKGFIDERWTPPGWALDATDRSKVDIETTDLFKLVTSPYACQVYLASLVIGGVLSRYPTLRIGVTELGAAWAEPFVLMLETRMAEFCGQAADGRSVLGLFADQVRITPFHWEDIGAMLSHPVLHRMYSFSTDFPHLEGGEDARSLADRATANVGGEARLSYFIEAGRSIMRG